MSARSRRLPPGLRDRVLIASLAARPSGHAVPEVAPAAPVEAFRNAAVRLASTLDSLSDAQWRTPAIRGLDVQGLIGHLIGVEYDVQRALAGDPDVGATDHVRSTQHFADRQAGRSPAATLADWRSAIEATISAIETHGDLAAVVPVHRVPLQLGDLLIGRTFELWAHENDIRRATGLPPSVPDAGTLRAMAALAAALLPFAVMRTDPPTDPPTDLPTGLPTDTPSDLRTDPSRRPRDPVAVRLVLTGPGGGSWDLPIGNVDPDATADLLIVADVVDFCRLVSNRVAPGEVAAYVTGDHATADLVLTAAASLALD